MTGSGTLDEDERQRRMMRIDPFQRMFMGGMEQISTPTIFDTAGTSSIPVDNKSSHLDVARTTKLPTTTATTAPVIPNGAICFICLEGDDEDDTTTINTTSTLLLLLLLESNWYGTVPVVATRLAFYTCHVWSSMLNKSVNRPLLNRPFRRHGDHVQT